MSQSQSLTKEQKEAVALLSVGTFLEYFDLMLYVHMAVLLNELFFPKTDPHTASLLSAFAFCSTFVFRPIGALFFGYIGDKIGRKQTVIFTTIIMAFSCILMATLPTYAQIGITASWLITACRILQGISSVGEIVGAELYLTETTKPPIQYPVVSAIAIASVIGTAVALGAASIFTSYGFDWRSAFWLGSAIAVIGGVARTTLRETPEFVDAKRRIKNRLENNNIDSKILDNDPILNERASKKTFAYFLAINCAWPICFYFAYIHCGNLLKSHFGLNPNEVIIHNFFVSLVQLAGLLLISWLSYRIYPLKILKVKLAVFSLLVLFFPYLITNATNTLHIFLLQCLMISFSLDTVPANSIFFRHFPVFNRFTYASFTYAFSRALMYIITSFGIIFLTRYFGNYGLLLVIMPINFLCVLGLDHFEKLEIASGHHIP
jgi:MHS family proline/betaine transporter-like MFS transporter